MGSYLIAHTLGLTRLCWCVQVNVTKASQKNLLVDRLLGNSLENDRDATMIGVVNRDIQDEADVDNAAGAHSQEMSLMIK